MFNSLAVDRISSSYGWGLNIFTNSKVFANSLTISIRDDIYEKLLRLKEEGEGFS